MSHIGVIALYTDEALLKELFIEFDKFQITVDSIVYLLAIPAFIKPILTFLKDNLKYLDGLIKALDEEK
ncbi:hypothetical protein [Photorhabdus antumapuensis]|uniref:hypothetical protein n=1 Tax=Photorhabdus antumapuensis TaxID=2862867 RepID=UPI001CEC2CAA|nr:hypothetical protein [Photorhabdus antumapuensis]MCA6220042.1 hypothetical protein [Photorhabdus antumapuensis]